MNERRNGNFAVLSGKKASEQGFHNGSIPRGVGAAPRLVLTSAPESLKS